MRSQTKWGLFFIILGLILVLIDMINSTFILSIYGVPSLLLGMSLIIFRKREERIEEVR